MRARPVPALAALTLCTFAFVTAESLPIGLLTPIAHGLGVGQSAVGLLVTGYAAVVVVATVPLTRWTRRVPRRALIAVLLAVFTAGTVLCGLADSYAALLLPRLLVALVQALFWAVVSPAAASLVGEAVQGRAVAIVNSGSALGPVLGVPAGTAVGQALGWRSAFLLLAAVGLLALVGVLATLPAAAAGEGRADRGERPDRVRFRLIVLVTALAITGAYAVFTFVTPFTAEVTGLPPASDGPLLLLRGSAGFLGAVVVGLVIDRAPVVPVVVVTTLQTLAFALQWLLGSTPGVVVAAVAVAGFTLSALAAANSARVLRYAPGDTAQASAVVSTAFNVGIMLGALTGSLAAAGAGVAAVPLVGAAASAIAVVVAAGELVLLRRPDAGRGADRRTTTDAPAARAAERSTGRSS